MKIRVYYYTLILFTFFSHIILVSAAGAVNKIMPLGDSITRGWPSGVIPDSEEYYISYRKALWDDLIAAGYDIDFVGSLNSGSAVFGATEPADHEGHGGWRDDHILNGKPDDPGAGKLADWLAEERPHIVMLHIGINGLDSNPDDVKAILDEIDTFESDNSVTIWVVLARIINLNCITDVPSCPESVTVMNFNTNVANMAQDRILTGDKILIVDMEYGAGIDYHLSTDDPAGDMWNSGHPFKTGYAKMANVWFSALMDILPLADAGPDQGVDEFETVTLDASGSFDPKSDNLSYQWVQTAGTPVVVLLPNDQAAQPFFDAPDAGPTGKTLTFTLTVTDEDGLVSTDTVGIQVAKISPQANAGTDQRVYEFDTVTLDGSGSGGVGLSYKWTQTPETSVLLSDSGAPQPSFVAPDVGIDGETLTFELTVTDDDGVVSSDRVNIAVRILPQADAGPDRTVGETATVTLDGSGSIVAASGNLSYLWEETTSSGVKIATMPMRLPPPFHRACRRGRTNPDVPVDGNR